jgi:lipopolysaccharide transport system ATP-binding protein
MQDPIISVRNLSKSYQLKAKGKGRDPGTPERAHANVQWALRDINIDIYRGETFGILGVNGSGKSTLLQLIAGIVTPTSGSATTKGRICPLLQLGAGFSPHFTGRENARLNAAILGMTKAEIEAAMEPIEAFADIGDYFDQPVRTYSSGMFARLAFSTAIHSQPDILIVDEILSVGDIRFQNRCFKRIKELQSDGKTILFVTHDTGSIVVHCQRAMLLDAGQIVDVGVPTEIVDLFIARLFGGPTVQAEQGMMPTRPLSKPVDAMNHALLQQDIPSELSALNDSTDQYSQRAGYNRYETRFGRRDAEVVDFALQYGGVSSAGFIPVGAELTLDLKVHFKRDVSAPMVGFSIKSVDGVYLHGTNTHMMGLHLESAQANSICVYRFAFRVCLAPRTYFLDVGVAEVDGTPGGSVLDVRRASILLTIQSPGHLMFDGLVDIGTVFAEMAVASTISGDSLTKCSDRATDTLDQSIPGDARA